jgi:hypothetical protein
VSTADFKATLIAESSKAIRVRLDTGREVWVPKSVIDDDSEVYDSDHDEGKLVVQEWWAEKEGLL